MTRARTITLGLIICLFAGCGGGAPQQSGPPRYPIKGKVTFDGQPVDGGTIAFVASDAKFRNTGGPITAGEYSIPAENGANEGTYTVQIRWEKPSGKKGKNLDTGKEEELTANVIPAKYGEMSAETRKIEPKENVIDFTLTK